MAPVRAVTRLSSNTEIKSTADKNTYEYYIEKAKTERKKRVTAAKAAKNKKDKGSIHLCLLSSTELIELNLYYTFYWNFEFLGYTRLKKHSLKIQIEKNT